MPTIYILLLEDNKYYVGKSNEPEFRLEKHFNGKGSVWTQKYKPVQVVELINNCDDYDEDKYTLKYMAKYGIENVRGGSFCEIILSEDNQNTITKMIIGSNDNCYICGVKGHFASQCIFKEIQKYKEDVNKKYSSESEEDTCFRCGRQGHYIEDCYAVIDVDGNKIIDKKKEKKVKKVKEKKTKKKAVKKNVCYRCGRDSHYADECYATTDIDGYIISDSE
jgi:hypothetical protein